MISEKVDYCTSSKRVARSEPPTRVILLSIKNEPAEPILPLTTTIKDSPWRMLAESDDDDLSEQASSFMGPGPWTFHRDLQLPSTCRMLHFTNKNKRSSIIVSHTLKCVMRVERGDDNAVDEKTGKRKLFDIVVQSPVHLLSVRLDLHYGLGDYSRTIL